MRWPSDWRLGCASSMPIRRAVAGRARPELDVARFARGAPEAAPVATRTLAGRSGRAHGVLRPGDGAAAPQTIRLVPRKAMSVEAALERCRDSSPAATGRIRRLPAAGLADIFLGRSACGVAGRSLELAKRGTIEIDQLAPLAPSGSGAMTDEGRGDRREAGRRGAALPEPRAPRRGAAAGAMSRTGGMCWPFRGARWRICVARCPARAARPAVGLPHRRERGAASGARRGTPPPAVEGGDGDPCHHRLPAARDAGRDRGGARRAGRARHAGPAGEAGWVRPRGRREVPGRRSPG